MRKIIGVLLLVLSVISLVSCGFSSNDLPKNIIMPSPLSEEQQEVINLFSIPNTRELLVYDFIAEEGYEKISVWVESYKNGILVELPSGLVSHSSTGELQKGRLAVTINQDENTFTYTLSMSNNGFMTSHTGTIEITESGLNRSYGSITDSVDIEDGKEIILYSSLFSRDSSFVAYDKQQYLYDQDFIGNYPFVQLLKVKFTK